MPLLLNLRHLEAHDLQLKGELPVEELELDLRDPMIQAEQPVGYRLEAQQIDGSLLLTGDLQLTLDCECVRCLKPFKYRLELKDWTRHLPLDGDEKVAVVNDCVDLTPLLREDILLEFPQHPLCEAGCRGLPKTDGGKAKKASGPGQNKPKPSAWGELDKLKF